MKKIGEFLENARIKANMSLMDLSKETRIKPEFIDSIEKEKWDQLPELPVIVGFVKSIAFALSLNKEQCVALLRRDYPPKPLVINPNPEIKSGLRVGPKFFFGIFVTVLIVIFGGYLFYQYRAFISPPKLTIIAPDNNEVVTTKTLTVRGTTDTNAAVRINNQPTNVSDDGSFTGEIEVIPQTHDIEIKAISRSGRETVVHRTISVEPKK